MPDIDFDQIPSKVLCDEEWEKMWTWVLETFDHSQEIYALKPYFKAVHYTSWARAKADSIRKMTELGNKIREGIQI